MPTLPDQFGQADNMRDTSVSENAFLKDMKMDKTAIQKYVGNLGCSSNI